MSSQKLSVFSISLDAHISWDQLFTAILHLDSSHCIITEQSSTYIGGCYLWDTIQNHTQYNIEKGIFETVPTQHQLILKFDIFVSQGLLLLWGNRKATTLFITLLEQASSNSITITSRNTDFKFLLRRIMHENTVKFQRMKISNIVIDQGVVANCSVNLCAIDSPSSLVVKYIDSISQITLAIGDVMELLSLTLYSNGSIIIYRDRDDIGEDVFSKIVSIIGGAI